VLEVELVEGTRASMSWPPLPAESVATPVRIVFAFAK